MIFFRLCHSPTSEATVKPEMSAARLKHFDWGREGEGLTAEEEAFVMARAETRFGTALKERLHSLSKALLSFHLVAPSVRGPGWKNGSARGRTKECHQAGGQNAIRPDTLIPKPLNCPPNRGKSKRDRLNGHN
jgi:hypothetical protein